MMKIKDVVETGVGDKVEFAAALTSVTDVISGPKSEFISITLKDNTGVLSTPIFENARKAHEVLEVGKVYSVSGLRSEYKGDVQIKDIVMKLYEGEYSPEDFIEAYSIDKSIINAFVAQVNKLKEPYRGIAKIVTGLDTDESRWKAFCKCPAAEKHHGNKLGGLLLHTIGVMSQVSSMVKTYRTLNMYGDVSSAIDMDRLLCKCIIHDAEKISEYEFDTCIRHNGNLINHEIRGASIINEIYRDNSVSGMTSDICEDLMLSILTHHGKWSVTNLEFGNVENLIVHLADMADSRIVGEMEKQ